jgi:hypothetical protein
VISTEEIAAEHRKAQTAFGEAVRHALRCGELLAEAKAQLQHGAWIPWLENNFDFSRQTASAYMRLAANREQVEMESAPSISAALKQLSPPKPEKVPCPGCGENVKPAKFGDGTTVSEAERLGVCRSCAGPVPKPYVIDTDRKRQLAESAKERLFRVLAPPDSLDAICKDGQGPGEALGLDRALAIATDEEVDAAIADLGRGIRRYKELRDELRRRRS